MFVLVMIVAVAIEGFSQSEIFMFTKNLTESQFAKAPSETKEVTEKYSPTTNLPNPVQNRIDVLLSDYTLHVGDCFLFGGIYRGMFYMVLLRITNPQISRWQFYAWSQINQ